VIILASQSPRRRELLAKIIDTFDVVPSEYDEKFDTTRPAEDVAVELALGKANAVAKHYPDAIVIGADTFIVVDGQQLGKPKNADDALGMLKNLSGKTHQVVTGVALVCKKQNVELSTVDRAAVTLKPFDEPKTRAYIANRAPYDLAGGYAVQENDAQFLIDHFEGDKETIIGLPTKIVRQMLPSVENELRK